MFSNLKQNVVTNDSLDIFDNESQKVDSDDEEQHKNLKKYIINRFSKENKNYTKINKTDLENKVEIEDDNLKIVFDNQLKSSIEYYEVAWFKMQCNFDKDLSDLTEYITLESIEIFTEQFPSLVNAYQNQIDEKKNSRSKKNYILL